MKQQYSYFSTQKIDNILKAIQAYIAQAKFEDEKRRVNDSRIKRIKSHMHSPHTQKQYTAITIDHESEFYDAQYSAPRPRSPGNTEKKVCLSRSVGGFDLSVLDSRGRIVLTSYFSASEKHKLHEAWKYLTDKHYQSHKDRIREDYRSGRKCGIESLSAGPSLVNQRDQHCDRSRPPVVSAFDDIPVLTDSVSVKGNRPG